MDLGDAPTPSLSSEFRCLAKGSLHDELHDEAAVADVAAVVDDVADGT